MFTPVEDTSAARFNSSTSCEFLTWYEESLGNQIRADEAEPSSQTFAPSSIRCKRISWFRLRGVQPEQEALVDYTLNFTAQVGTACHRTMQENLIAWLGDDWLDVEEYLKNINPSYIYKCTKNGTETSVEIEDPPVKFSPDGIIRYNGEVMLLEIKTSEYSSFGKLGEPKKHHMDQVRCYCALLGLSKALVVYQDRLYGDLKCFEVSFKKYELDQVWEMFKDVQDCVSKNIAPPKLPYGDSWCTKAHCRYYGKCQEW